LRCIKAGWQLDWDLDKIADYLRQAGMSDEQIKSAQIMVVSAKGLAAQALNLEMSKEIGIDTHYIEGCVDRETHQMTLMMGVFGGDYGQNCLNSVFTHESVHLVESFTMSNEVREREDAESAIATLKSFGYSVKNNWRETARQIGVKGLFHAIQANRPAEQRAKEAATEKCPPEAFFTLRHPTKKTG
jgi:hypothetical protein